MARVSEVVALSDECVGICVVPRDGKGVCGGFGREGVGRELVGKSSSSHIEAKRAADACMLALGGRSSSSS